MTCHFRGRYSPEFIPITGAQIRRTTKRPKLISQKRPYKSNQMSLTCRVINAKPTKVSKHYCQMHFSLSCLSVAHLVCSVLDIRRNTVKPGHM